MPAKNKMQTVFLIQDKQSYVCLNRLLTNLLPADVSTTRILSRKTHMYPNTPTNFRELADCFIVA